MTEGKRLNELNESIFPKLVETSSTVVNDLVYVPLLLFLWGFSGELPPFV